MQGSFLQWSQLKGKVVIITGASSGFGASAAKLFASEGCRVVLAARRLDRLEELAKEIRDAGGPFTLTGKYIT